MREKENVIFLGCNYSNKKIKGHFNNLKERLEEDFPVRVVLIDKERGKGSADLWKQIRMAIEQASLAIFDVTAFRPNVVLELGYALAKKDESSILITVDTRRKNGESDEWKLSDIGHLKRVQYKTIKQLDEQLEEHLNNVPAIERINALWEQADNETTIPDKYYDVALEVLKALRDGNSFGDAGIRTISQGTSVPFKTLSRLLKKNKLATRSQGSNGRWKLVE